MSFDYFQDLEFDGIDLEIERLKKEEKNLVKLVKTENKEAGHKIRSHRESIRELADYIIRHTKFRKYRLDAIIELKNLMANEREILAYHEIISEGGGFARITEKEGIETKFTAYFGLEDKEDFPEFAENMSYLNRARLMYKDNPQTWSSNLLAVSLRILQAIESPKYEIDYIFRETVQKIERALKEVRQLTDEELKKDNDRIETPESKSLWEDLYAHTRMI